MLVKVFEGLGRGEEKADRRNAENEEEWPKTQRARSLSMKVIRPCSGCCHVEKVINLLRSP
jgi:hypothetical protein